MLFLLCQSSTMTWLNSTWCSFCATPLCFAWLCCAICCSFSPCNVDDYACIFYTAEYIWCYSLDFSNFLCFAHQLPIFTNIWYLTIIIHLKWVFVVHISLGISATSSSQTYTWSFHQQNMYVLGASGSSWMALDGTGQNLICCAVLHRGFQRLPVHTGFVDDLSNHVLALKGNSKGKRSHWTYPRNDPINGRYFIFCNFFSLSMLRILSQV